MKLGIDASNIRGGGGVTHLVNLLQAANPQQYNFEQVIVWGGSSILKQLEEYRWLNKVYVPLLDRTLPFRVYWQRFQLAQLADEAQCDLLFFPGGSYSGTFHPFVTMSRNMLPFDWVEMRRYGLSKTFLRLMLLRGLQSQSFRRADGMIFLTKYACNAVMGVVKQLDGYSEIIPHGVDTRFRKMPREQLAINHYSETYPFRIMYVSIVDVYKHQWYVVDAVSQLKKAGIPVQLEMIGPAYAPSLKRLSKVQNQVDGTGKFIYYRGSIVYQDLPLWYHKVNLFVFASSCENMPNILLEAMAAGLPIACSNKEPMPEILGEAGIYFDPEKPDEIFAALRLLISSPTLRIEKAQAAYERSQTFSWQRCADETFNFLAKVVKKASTNSLESVVGRGG